MQELESWFPDLPDETRTKLDAYSQLMREWNSKINLVSRKDIDAFETHHLAPCLAITLKLKLMDGARVLDVGTGGGLPGLVMAICYPQARFLLADSIGKKTQVVFDIAQRLALKNVEVRQCRVETLTRRFDFITGRAVTALPAFISWIKPLANPGRKHSLENGLLYWKGGPLAEELSTLGIQPLHTWPLNDLLPGGDYPEKVILHFSARDLPRARKPKID